MLMAGNINGILFIDSSPFYGEPQRSLATLIGNLDCSQFQPYLLCADDTDTGLLSRFRESKRIPTQAVSLAGSRYSVDLMTPIVRDVLQFRRTIRSWIHDYDIALVIANDYYSGLLCFFSLPSKTRFLYVLRDSFVPKPAVVQIVRRSSRTLAVAESVRADWSFHLDYRSASKITVIPDCIDFGSERHLLNKFSYRENYDWPDETILVSMFGDMVPWYRHELFIRALAKAVQSKPDLFGLIVGKTADEDGIDYGDELVELARELNVFGNMAIMECVDQNQWIIDASNVVVAIGENEPFPFSVVRALATNKPVVVSEGGSQAEICRGNRLATVVPADVDAVCNGILQASTLNPDANGAADRSKTATAVQTRYSIESRIGDFQNLFRDCIQ